MDVGQDRAASASVVLDLEKNERSSLCQAISKRELPCFIQCK